MDWLLWVDIETSGLNVENDYILQLACILTNFKDTVIHYKQEFTFGHDKFILDNMSEWCQKQHAESGLIERVLESTLQLQEAEKQILMNMNLHLTIRDKLYLAGNSVHFDKKFIDKHMPVLSSRLSHRIIDVSTVAILCKNLAPEIYEFRPTKMHCHTAMQDILESMNEYRYYRTCFINCSQSMN